MSKKVVLCFFQTIEDIPCHWCDGTGKEKRRVGFWGRLKEVECYSCKGTGILKDYPTQYAPQMHLDVNHPEVKALFDKARQQIEEAREERITEKRKANIKVVGGEESG
jgi:hypothetical protein